MAQVYTNALVLSMLLPLEYRRAHARHPGRARNSQTDIYKGAATADDARRTQVVQIRTRASIQKPYYE